MADSFILWVTSLISILIYTGLLIFAFHNICRYIRKQATNYTLLFFYISVIFVCCARGVCLGTIIASLVREGVYINVFSRSYWLCRELILFFEVAVGLSLISMH
jgi:hypothetical protein